jgi:hypothetical protein
MTTFAVAQNALTTTEPVSTRPATTSCNPLSAGIVTSIVSSGLVVPPNSMVSFRAVVSELKA